MVEPGRHKSSTKGNVLEDVTEDKEGERRLEEEEEEAFFDENEEAVKAPSQLGEDQDAFGRQVQWAIFLYLRRHILIKSCLLDFSVNRFLATLATGLPRKGHQE